MKPLAEDNNPLFIRYPVNLVLNASSYHDIARFISKVESYPNIYMVESMRIDPVDRSKEAEAIYRLSVSLTISTVSFKD